ncbi:MAG: glycosyltransferase family 2 protein [Bdellovibrionales bacterium]|nr:glycosyltransferase family 2 protein [Bdellovibrionales bacterium]
MKLAVVIPCFRVRKHILSVLEGIPENVHRIFVVDDACPERTGELVLQECKDKRVSVITHDGNQGVGGATLTGFKAAVDEGMEILIKLDGDEQVDPALIPVLVKPLLNYEADYTKGNRFYDLESLREMPALRLVGNSILSLISKAATGYWDLMDPTNGFLAIHSSVFNLLPIEKISKRFFFENDLLFRLSTIRAVARDVPMASKYGSEISNLDIPLILLTFPMKFVSRTIKRIIYSYFVRDFNICSMQLIVGIVLLIFGVVFGMFYWISNSALGIVTPTGTVMIAAILVILGFQLLLAAITYDVMNLPKIPLSSSLHSTFGSTNFEET